MSDGAALLMDTENVFHGFGFSENGLRRAMALALLSGQKVNAADYTTARNARRAEQALTAVLAWAEAQVHSPLSARVSFGKKRDPGVVAVAPYFAVQQIAHRNANSDPHDAEKRLIAELTRMKDEHSAFVIGGTDILIRRAVTSLVAGGWSVSFAFIAPPTAGSLLDSTYGTYDSLNKATGALLVRKNPDSTIARPYFVYLHDICIAANLAAKRSRGPAQPGRRPVPAAVASTRPATPIDNLHSGLTAIPGNQWHNAVTTALAGRLARPSAEHPLGSNGWRERLGRGLERTSNLKAFAGQLADILTDVYATIPAARAELDDYLTEPSSTQQWNRWSATAVLVPRVREGATEPNKDPVRAVFLHARTWVDGAR